MKITKRPVIRTVLKIFVPIFAFIVILFVAGYFLLTSFLTPTRLQAMAQKMATQALQRPVDIGRVGLSIGFRIGINIKDISIPNTEGFRPGPMVKIGKTTLHLQLLPLLTRMVVISSIELYKAQANIELNKDKELNFGGLVPKEAQGTGWRISLSNIRIRDSKINYWNAIDRTEYTVKDISQQIKIRRNRIAISGNLTASIPEAENIPKLDMKINNAIEYDTLSKDINIKNISVSTRPARLKVSGVLEKSTNLDLDANVDLSDLSKLSSLLPKNAQPEDMAGAIKGDFQIKGTTNKPTINGKFRLNDIKIVPKGMKRGIENVTGTLSFDREAIEDIDIKGNIGGTQFSISGTVSDILTKKPLLRISAEVKGDLKDFQGLTDDAKSINMKGVLSSNIQVRGSGDKPLLAGDLRITNATIDGIGLGKPVSNMNLDARLTEDDIRITSCKGEIGRSDFSFTGEIRNFKKPNIHIDNRSRNIDLDEIMPQTKQGAAKESNTVPVSISGSLVINRLTGMDMEFRDINTDFKYENGVIDIRNCRAKSFDGDVYLNFYYNANSPEPYQLSTRMQSVSAQKILKRFLKFERVQGSLSGTADFNGRGLDQKSVVSNLDARGNLRFKNGTFNNFPLLVKLLDWLGMKDYSNVQYDDMQGVFTIKNGQARVDDWTLSSRAGDFLTNGSIGLDGKLNLQIAATLSRSNSAVVKRYHGDWLFYIDNTGQAVIDIIVTGKQDAPAFRLDNNKIKQRLAGKVKDEFKQKKQEFEQKIRDWLKWK